MASKNLLGGCGEEGRQDRLLRWPGKKAGGIMAVYPPSSCIVTHLSMTCGCQIINTYVYFPDSNAKNSFNRRGTPPVFLGMVVKPRLKEPPQFLLSFFVV